MVHRTQAQDIMARPVITISADDTLAEAARRMVDHNVGCLPVLDDVGKLVGIVTLTDLFVRRRIIPFSTVEVPELLGEMTSLSEIATVYRKRQMMPVRSAMKTQVITVDPATAVGDIVDIMMKCNIKRVPVVDAGRLVGIVSRQDLLKLLAATWPGRLRKPA